MAEQVGWLDSARAALEETQRAMEHTALYEAVMSGPNPPEHGSATPMTSMRNVMSYSRDFVRVYVPRYTGWGLRDWYVNPAYYADLAEAICQGTRPKKSMPVVDEVGGLLRDLDARSTQAIKGSIERIRTCMKAPQFRVSVPKVDVAVLQSWVDAALSALSEGAAGTAPEHKVIDSLEEKVDTLWAMFDPSGGTPTEGGEFVDLMSRELQASADRTIAALRDEMVALMREEARQQVSEKVLEMMRDEVKATAVATEARLIATAVEKSWKDFESHVREQIQAVHAAIDSSVNNALDGKIRRWGAAAVGAFTIFGVVTGIVWGRL